MQAKISPLARTWHPVHRFTWPLQLLCGPSSFKYGLHLSGRSCPGILMTGAELLWLRNHLREPLPVLHHHPDNTVLPRRRYIHCRSLNNFHHYNSKAKMSFWSISHHPPRYTDQTVDHHASASITRLTNTPTKHDNITVNFGLLDIRSLMSKRHIIQDLLTDHKLDFLCLTETWQQPNDLSQLIDPTPSGFDYI